MACRLLDVSSCGYYDWAQSATLGANGSRRGADNHDPTHPRGQAGWLWCDAGAGRFAARAQRPRRPETRREVDAAERAGKIFHRRKRRGRKPDTATHEDLVKRRFRADAPNRLWFCDITQHRARDGWVYLTAVIDAFSRRIVWWSISDRIAAETMTGVILGSGYTVANLGGTLRISATGTSAQFRVLLAVGATDVVVQDDHTVRVGEVAYDLNWLGAFDGGPA